MRLVYLTSFFFLISISLVSAATKDLIVDQDVITGDVTPPTAPAIVSVVPTTTSQIDITWSTSTDNIFMDGYQIFRDAVAIATTSQQSYSDTGLTASTTYSYSVRSFDAARNYSTTSLAVATTTPAPPPVVVATTSTSSSSGIISRGGIRLLDFDVVTDASNATLRWRTDVYTSYSLRWGRTSSYETGYVSSATFARNHQTVITDLEPGTTYEFELIGRMGSGSSYVLETGRFTTQVLPDDVPPQNVFNLKAWQVDDGVRLEWFNPPDDDFSHVRVLRNHWFFPTDPADGFLVYQGNGQVIFDESAFVNGPVAYYTVFAYDENGNISSGAVIHVRRYGEATPIYDFEVATSTVGQEDFDAIDIRFTDLEIRQNDRLLPVESGKVAIDGSRPLSMSIDYDKLPEHLKTITVTLTKGDNDRESFSFLLRVNKDKSAYEAVLAPLGQSGYFGVDVTVFDFKTKVAKHLSGGLQSENNGLSRVRSTITEVTYSTGRIIAITFGLLIILLLITFSLYLRERRRRRS